MICFNNINVSWVNMDRWGEESDTCGSDTGWWRDMACLQLGPPREG